MLPDRVSNPGPLTYESGALPIALRGPANIIEEKLTSSIINTYTHLSRLRLPGCRLKFGMVINFGSASWSGIDIGYNTRRIVSSSLCVASIPFANESLPDSENTSEIR